MCFGSNKTTSTTQTTTVPDWLQTAGQENVDWLKAKRDETYSAPRVAGPTADQNTAYDLIRTLAGSSNPYTGTAAGAYTTAANKAPTQIGDVSKWMNPYIEQALAPQLKGIARQGDQQRQGIAAQATGAGAFGDSRHGILESEQMRNEAQQVADTRAQGYNTAYNSALDIAKTNASLEEQGLLRALTGANGLIGLDKYNTGRGADLATLLMGAGNQQRGMDQASLDAMYQDFLRQIQGGQGLSSVMASTPYTKTTTGTQTQPDNSGFGILGSLAGAALAPFTGGASRALGGLGGSLAGSLFGGGGNYGQSYNTNYGGVSMPVFGFA